MHPTHTLMCICVIGDPVSLKRTAWGNLRARMAGLYDSQRIEKVSLGLSITAALDAEHKEPIDFGREEVTVFFFNF